MPTTEDIAGLNRKFTYENITKFAQNRQPDTFKSASPVTPATGLNWCALQFLTATTCSEIKEITNGAGAATAALAIAYAAGTIIYGQFTSCTGDGTGTVRAYYYSPL